MPERFLFEVNIGIPQEEATGISEQSGEQSPPAFSPEIKAGGKSVQVEEQSPQLDILRSVRREEASLRCEGMRAQSVHTFP